MTLGEVGKAEERVEAALDTAHEKQYEGE
jgi:hypothetical protein